MTGPIKAVISDKSVEIRLIDETTLLIDGQPFSFRITPEKNISRIEYDNQHHNILVNPLTDTCYEIWIKHFIVKVYLEDHRTALLSRYKQSIIQDQKEIVVAAPMPGMLLEVDVSAGAIVTAGSRLGLLEAMKMENEIRSPANGIVQSVRIEQGMVVEKGEELFIIKIV
ncbi:MAG TPA: acetyl-CoA carboxylase biotin carboxyl carrier protein subunit [Bacteroidota bacterium]|nr:acetyl-CoA carboxylase biotin carboxyl carrier protein subunit [Bacteroidota bacterium]